MTAGKWRIKPSAKLPIFLRFMINSSFTLENAKKAGLYHTMPNRVYLNHMMYWPADEYNPFEEEVINHLEKNDGWFEHYCADQLRRSEHLYNRGLELEKIDWPTRTNEDMSAVLEDLLQEYRELACGWYAQYPLDEYFEHALEAKLIEYLPADDPRFREYVLIFADPEQMTEVSEERWKLAALAKKFFANNNEDLDHLSASARAEIDQHLDKFAYINRGLATSKPFIFDDIIARLKELQHQVEQGKIIDEIIFDASQEKVDQEYQRVLKIVNPRDDLQCIISQARHHSYLRNRRVEAFFRADYGASFMYAEIARRARFNSDWIMEISIPEMFGALRGAPLPTEEEMRQRFKNYAMVVRNSETTLIINPAEIKKLEQEYSVQVSATAELKGRVACVGGIIRGRAKVCFNKNEIGRVQRGDILVTQFTTPDFVPAMEKAAAILADQGGLSSHAAIVSRELGVPCIIATERGTRVIHDNDLLEVDAKTGIIKIIERA